MTFVRAQRYLQAGKGASAEQFFALCMRLGRIHTGIRKICVFDNIGGSCRAAYLESILQSAGYRTGRLTKAATDGLRSRIYLDGQPISHKQVCDMTDQIMQAIDGMQKEQGSESAIDFDSEQKICALALLAFCCHGCDVIIFEASGDFASDPMAVAAPFSLVMPSGFGTKDTAAAKKQATDACQAIRRGTREVITGFTGGEVYNLISQACAAAGSRLTVPAKSEAQIGESSLSRTDFSYRGKGPYRLHSSFEVQFEAALAAIEACYALRRDGVRLPGAAIIAGIGRAKAGLCFDVLTVRPGIVVSVTGSVEDTRAVLAALHQKSNSFGGKVVLCAPRVSGRLLAAFEKEFSDADEYAVCDVVLVGEAEELPAQYANVQVGTCPSYKKAAKQLLCYTDPDVSVLCLGDPAFCYGIKSAVNDALIGLS